MNALGIAVMTLAIAIGALIITLAIAILFIIKCLVKDKKECCKVNKKQKELMEYLKNIINKSGGALPADTRLEQYAREITSIVVKG